jgi:hypothetical protein
LDRSTVDRWTRSTAPVHGRASALRQPGQSQSATWCYLSPFTVCLCSFAKRTLQFPKLQAGPSTLKNHYI